MLGEVITINPNAFPNAGYQSPNYIKGDDPFAYDTWQIQNWFWNQKQQQQQIFNAGVLQDFVDDRKAQDSQGAGLSTGAMIMLGIAGMLIFLGASR